MARIVRKYTAYILLLLAVAVQLVAGDQMVLLCKSLDERLELVKKDSSLVYRTAIEYLANKRSGLLNRRTRESRKLADAFTTVFTRDCSVDPYKTLSVIADCEPTQRDNMQTLMAIIRNYLSECTRKELWDEQLEKDEKLMSTKYRRIMRHTFSDEFIIQYLEDNPQDPDLHFFVKSRHNCCKVRCAGHSMFTALTKNQGLSNPDEHHRTHLDDLFLMVKEQAIVPCAKYIDAIDSLMTRAAIINLINEGVDRVLPGTTLFSENFRSALYRYRFCVSLSRDGGEKQLMGTIKHYLQTGIKQCPLFEFGPGGAIKD